MGENSQSSVDEVISLEEVGGDHGSHSTIAFSKKALHQRDADENLFLRFLELDPPGDASAVANRRQSTTKPSNGRTPFTMTKKLTRTGESRGFGFSIVWTHPPRVEKVEPGQCAERAGIWPGDYVIFVDKHNVVTMPEVDILNLIRSQGNSLTLEIFRRPAQQRGPVATHTTPSTSHQTPVHVHSQASDTPSHQQNGPQLNRLSSGTQLAGTRSSIACSNASISAETTKRRLHLPQVTFSKESILPQSGDDQRRRYLYQLISREQHFVNALQFGMERFTSPLRERKDLISPSDHRTLFQNIDELQRISEDILEQLVHEDMEPQQVNFASRVYMSKTTAICVAYKKYCNGLKRADCVLVNKSRHANSEFVKFISEPQVPRKRPDLTSFIHRPLQHFREVLKLIQVTTSHCRLDSEEYRNFSQVVLELQAAYREITVGGGLMEPLGEGKPLLTLQDLESRLVFTRCKPFVLASPGRQWVFGGDLSRVEGRSVKPYWALLFSDILLFAKVSRDRVLFITEEPLPLVNITDSCFNIRKKSTEFRITIDPLGKMAESPTAHCTPDLTKTPRRNSRRRSIILRAPSSELKAVWQNLLQRQIFLVNAALGSTPLSSPLDSPDVMQSLIPLSSDIGAATTSMASIKLSSVDSLAVKSNQQQEPETASIDPSKQLEEFIDEKCRQMNKSGTPRGGALHLAQWMKGQLDQAISKHESERTALLSQSEPTESEPEDDNIEEWTTEQVRKRSRELQLIDVNGRCQMPKADGASKSKEGANGTTVRADDLSGASEVEDESKSASRSTTSDSQITVRSSPVAHATDTISVCRQCHKNCSKGKLSHSSASSNSLKVQHNQRNTGTRCCQASTTASSITSGTSSSASTTTLTTGEVELRTTAIRKTHQNPLPNGFPKRHMMCHCKCTPQDFHGTTISPDEITQETCKILDGVHEIRKIDQLNHIDGAVNHASPHGKCKCAFTEAPKEDSTDDWSLMLIGLSQINPTSTLMHQDPFEAVPSISVVPPTPDGANTSRASAQMWDGGKGSQMTKGNSKDDENSPEDESPHEEPPYKVLSTSLRRYGTLSSLEKLPSEDAETYNSSDEDVADDGDIKIVTKEVYGPNDGYNPSLRNWTARAGSYMVEKMSFFEESRAFFDKYLGRWDREAEQQLAGAGLDEDIMDECTSGATSGEEVWGTPTSGGENDEIQMFNSDHTQSSPERSSSSFTGDDDTELMMDELLMAPPMTASAVRGLLPRRRLEPLFEEDTESGESEEENMVDGRTPLNQGQVAERDWSRNGPISKDSPESTTSETLSEATVSTPRELESTVISMPTEVADLEMDVEVSAPPAVTKVEEDFGSVADTCSSPSQTPRDASVSAASTDRAEGSSSAAAHVGLSPRLEMRLALNRDIMGDEDLISYDPGPDLTTILGHDLSTFQRLTGRDLLTRSANPRVAIVKEAGSNSYYQQKNSKMDTPTPNRKKSNPSTWSSSASVDLADEKRLSDLERLARREKMYCMSQLRSGQLAAQTDPSQTNSPNTTPSRRPSKIFSFLTRRNSENHLPKVFPKEMGDDLSVSSKSCSPRRENDKALERRFWKQLTRRRRHSVSEISAN